MAEQSFVFGREGHYIPEIQKKIHWEVIVTDTEVLIVQRGGPLEPTILSIKGKDLDVTDWWGWGAS